MLPISFTAMVYNEWPNQMSDAWSVTLTVQNADQFSSKCVLEVIRIIKNIISNILIKWFMKLEARFHRTFHIMHSILPINQSISQSSNQLINQSHNPNNYSEPNKKTCSLWWTKSNRNLILHLILLQLRVGLEATQSNLESMKSDWNAFTVCLKNRSKVRQNKL